MLKNQRGLISIYRTLMAMTVPIAFSALLGCGNGGESSTIASNLSTPANASEGSVSERSSDSREVQQTEQASLKTSSATDVSTDPAAAPDSTDEDSMPLPTISSEEESMLTATPKAPGVSARINWNPSPDSSVTSYYVYYGTQPSGELGSCSYEQSQAVESPPAIITGLEPNTPYFFAISAFNESESPCSTEFMLVTPSVSPEET
ncbi:MAG: fibronectin type III domain-containing protein [Nitrospira sp.]|nr:fibronectin type III domain-containing protein [Nitrospira sp.]